MNKVVNTKRAVLPSRHGPSVEVLQLWFDFMVEAGKYPGEWDPEVEIELRPGPDETFDQWLRRRREGFIPLSNAVIAYDSLAEAVEDLTDLVESGGDLVQHSFAARVDLRATNKEILEDFGHWLASARRHRNHARGPGRPTGAAFWVDYAPNGHVDVLSLRQSLEVLSKRRLHPHESNEQIWGLALQDFPDAHKGSVDVKSKRSVVSRRLKQAMNIIEGVRSGRFPCHDRELGRWSAD